MLYHWNHAPALWPSCFLRRGLWNLPGLAYNHYYLSASRVAGNTGMHLHFFILKEKEKICYSSVRKLTLKSKEDME
jgi:hypothetical protein